MIAHNCIITTNDVYLNNNNNLKFIIMNENRKINVLLFRVVTDSRFGELPLVLLAIEVQNGTLKQQAELRLEHTNVLTGRRVRTATTAQILKFIAGAMNERTCANVRITESLTAYIASL